MMKQHQKPVKSLGNRRRLVRYVIAIAATVLVVLLANLFYKTTSLSADELFSANYLKYELTTTRDPAQEETEVERAYRSGDFRRVTMISDTATDTRSIFLSALSFLELKDDANAIGHFRQVIAINDSTGAKKFQDESEYYLALAYLRNKNYDQALALAQKIQSDAGHVYHERITDKLIEDIKKLM
jgi:tetratricopeptide (TPR) repeat protein